MDKGISINNYNEMLRTIVAEVKMTRVVIANRLSVSLTQLYWNIGKRLSSENNILPQAVAELPWGHNRLILSKIKDKQEALYNEPEKEIKSMIIRELNQQQP